VFLFRLCAARNDVTSALWHKFRLGTQKVRLVIIACHDPEGVFTKLDVRQFEPDAVSMSVRHHRYLHEDTLPFTIWSIALLQITEKSHHFECHIFLLR
jgi:hypothetical protein